MELVLIPQCITANYAKFDGVGSLVAGFQQVPKYFYGTSVISFLRFSVQDQDSANEESVAICDRPEKNVSNRLHFYCQYSVLASVIEPER